MHIEIRISLKPGLKKYLSARISTSPFTLCKTNSFGIFLFQCLVLRPDLKKNSVAVIDLERYSETMTIRISDGIWKRKGWYINNQSILDFNKFVSDLMDRELYLFMDLKTKVGHQKIYSSFLAFREKYDLTEEDLPIKTMEKKYERYRKA